MLSSDFGPCLRAAGRSPYGGAVRRVSVLPWRALRSRISERAVAERLDLKEAIDLFNRKIEKFNFTNELRKCCCNVLEILVYQNFRRLSTDFVVFSEFF